MFYFIINEAQQVWQSEYIRTYKELMVKYKIPHTFTDLKTLPKNQVRDTDFIWILHYKDLDEDWSWTNAKTIFRISGTSAHPWCYQVNQEKERQHFSKIDYMLAPTESVKSAILNWLGSECKSKILVTGYPMADPVKRYKLKLKPLPERKKRILIGGRLSPDKQPMLAMFILSNLNLQEKYEIIFCVPNEKEFQWLDIYGGRERWERLGFKFEYHNHQEWLELLLDSRFYFSTSLGDTMCYSAFEAHQLGCICIVPNMEHGNIKLPVMTDAIATHYSYLPFDYSDIGSKFKLAKKNLKTYRKPRGQSMNTNPELFLQRLLEGINYDSN